MFIPLPFPDAQATVEVLTPIDLMDTYGSIHMMFAVSLETAPKTQTAYVESHPVYKMWRGHELFLVGMLDAVNTKLNDLGCETDPSVQDEEAYIHWAATSFGSGDAPLGPPSIVERVDFQNGMKAHLLRGDMFYAKHFKGIDMSWPLVWA